MLLPLSVSLLARFYFPYIFVRFVISAPGRNTVVQKGVCGCMKQRGNRVGVFSVVSAFVGTLVGAGFASGQELMRFFAGFGSVGYAGIALSVLGFYFLARLTMTVARRRNTANFEAVIAPPGRWMRVLAGGIVFFFSLILLPVMFAGSGALLSSLFGGNTFPGALLMAVLVAGVGLFGRAGLLASFRFVVPLMILVSLLLGAVATLSPPLTPVSYAAPETAVSHWMLAALLFVSYNTVGVIAVLSPFGPALDSARSIRRGALFGALILGAMAALLCSALLHSGAADSDLPLYAIALGLGGAWGPVYAGVLLIAIFTTAAGIVFALTERLSAFRHPLFSRRPLTVGALTAASLAASRLGFAALIDFLYPLSGYLGFWIIGCLVWNALSLEPDKKAKK